MATKPTNEKVQVQPNAGLIDGLQAAGRYALVLVGFATALLAFFRSRDLAGAATYIQNNLGQAVGAVAGLISLGTALYGILKTGKRGGQLETAAANPDNKDVSFKQ